MTRRAPACAKANCAGVSVSCTTTSPSRWKIAAARSTSVGWTASTSSTQRSSLDAGCVPRRSYGACSRDATEAGVGPALGVLELHHVADSVRTVGRPAVPALVIREVDVARLAQERLR